MDEHGVNVHALLQLVMLCVALAGCGNVMAPAQASEADAPDMRTAVEVVTASAATAAGTIRASGLVG